MVPMPSRKKKIEEERQQRMNVLRNVIFDLQKVQNSSYQIYLERKEEFKDFQEHLRRYTKFIDFKQENPYSEKDMEFEISPTPRARATTQNNFVNFASSESQPA